MSREPEFKFRLYIAGQTENSTQAFANLKALCDARLADRHQIEVVDVFKEPKRALKDAIFMTPTLVKVSPAPGLKIVGTLAQAGPVLQALGLEGIPP